ncbi:MAG: HRDC domain-containing protein [Spirochaetaceae bacterium]
MQPDRYIDTDREFRSWLGTIPADQPAIAVDIEAEFNLHIYGEHFCLLQAFDGRRAVAVDPQSVSIELIRDFLESRDRLKITYDCSSDRLLLFRNHSILMRPVIDLRPAVKLLGFQKQGLGAVLQQVLGIAPAREKERFQQYDWTKRPINAEALAYAVDDVVHLYRLHDELLSRITGAGLLDRFLLENFRLQDHDPDTDREAGVLRRARKQRLAPRQQKLLEALHARREAVAREVNLPPNTVYPNRDLLSVAVGERAPRQAQRSRNVPRDAFERLVRELEDIVARS